MYKWALTKVPKDITFRTNEQSPLMVGDKDKASGQVHVTNMALGSNPDRELVKAVRNKTKELICEFPFYKCPKVLCSEQERARKLLYHLDTPYIAENIVTLAVSFEKLEDNSGWHFADYVRWRACDR